MKKYISITTFLFTMIAIIFQSYSSMACTSHSYVGDYSSSLSAEIAGIGAMVENNYLKAINAYSEAIKMDKNENNLSKYYARRGMAYLYTGELEKARKDIMYSLKLNPDNEYSKSILQHILVPIDAFYAYDRGQKARKEKNYDFAIEEYTKAIILAPDYIDAYYERGLSYFEKGEEFYDKAEIDLNETIRFNKKSILPFAYTILGNIYRDQGNLSKSLTYYNEALMIDKSHYGAKKGIESLDNIALNKEYELANVARDKKDYSIAITKYNNVLKIDPNHLGARNSLAQVEYELANVSRDKKDYITALTHYRNVLKINPEHTEAKNNLQTVMNKRITEDSIRYPSPFEGKWSGTIAEGKNVPGKEEIYYTDRVEYYTEYVTDHLGQRIALYRTRTVKEPHTRYIPGIYVPAINGVYEFRSKNYTFSTGESNNMSLVKKGIFYYSGNTIELDDGTILLFTNNVINSGGLTFNKL